jgi:Na+-transporting NADH:ubiquinone oxidoreductase subunit B
MLSTLVSAALFSTIFFLTDLSPIPPHYAMVSGSLLFVAVFMTTDPVSAPNKPAAQWIYGALIGAVAIVIRTFSAFPEGTSFGILVGNTFASLIDEMVPKKKKAKRRAQV